MRPKVMNVIQILRVHRFYKMILKYGWKVTGVERKGNTVIAQVESPYLDPTLLKPFEKELYVKVMTMTVRLEPIEVNK